MSLTISQVKDETALTFGAFDGSHLLGTVSCYLFLGANEALLKCLQVTPERRHQGIGAKLMEHLLSYLKSLEVRILTFQYNAYEESAPFLEKILKKTGFAPPQILMRRYFLDQYSFHPDWYFSPFPLLPTDCTLFPWSEATPEETEIAKSWVRNNPALFQISPFDNPHPIDPISSLGLRCQGKLAGWMINHLVTPKLLRYSAFYVTPEIRGLGPALCLLRESIRRHLQNQIDLEACMEINFKHSSSSWLRFIKTRLAPFASHHEDVKYVWISPTN